MTRTEHHITVKPHDPEAHSHRTPDLRGVLVRSFDVVATGKHLMHARGSISACKYMYIKVGFCRQSFTSHHTRALTGRIYRVPQKELESALQDCQAAAVHAYTVSKFIQS